MKEIVLGADEHVLMQTRRHWAIFFRDAAATLGIGGMFFVLLGLVAVPSTFGLTQSLFLTLLAFGEVLWVLLVWLALATIWTNYYLDIWLITDRRLVSINQTGLFQRTVATWQYKDIQEVVTETRNPIQSFFDYGLVRIRTGGAPGRVHMGGVPFPAQIAALILKQVETYRALEKANKQQEALLHTISHETKAHLTKNEAAFAAIVEGDYGVVPEKLKTMVRDALAETRSGVNMVMSLLSSSDFKTGALRLKHGPFDLSKTVESVCAQSRPQAEQKGLVLSCSVRDAAQVVNGDEEKVREQVIRNLVDNAIRYTPRGSVNVGVVRIENAAVVIVADTGIGILPDERAKLFTQGGKGTRSTAINPSSTGFGLFIAKQIVDAHGGAMWADSDGADQGSTFYVALPLAEGSSPRSNTV